jgi:TolA-binding protein
VKSHHLESHDVSADFKFTDARSFRLFVEGMKGLRAYEHSAEREGLRTAETKLAACVSDYPRDILPQFYLGVVRIFQGYDGANDAIRIFQSISRDVPELRAEAMYNVAQAYIEQYTPASLDAARDWLKRCIAEIGNSKKPEDVRLRLQAEVLLLFYEIRQGLWMKRKGPLDTLQNEIKNTAPQLRGKLDAFLAELNRAKIPDAARADIMADFWNAQGLLEEFQAWTISDSTKKDELARTAIESFALSLKFKLNWIPPKSNMARIYMELLNDYDAAIRCLQEVEQVRPNDNYSEYMLGRLFEKKNDPLTAISHYEKAPYISEAKKRLAVLYEESGRLNDAISLWQEVLAKRPDDEDALAAQVRLKFRTTPASGGQPTN